MSRVCTVCAHPDRESIDESLVMGEPMRAIAIRVGDVSKDALSRHRQHISPALQRLAEARADAGPISAADRLETLYSRAMTVLDAAEAGGQATLSLAAIRELRGLTETLAKISGELDERPTVNVLNVATAPEWLAVRGAMMAALLPYPEAAQAVAGRLAALEAGPS